MDGDDSVEVLGVRPGRVLHQHEQQVARLRVELRELVALSVLPGVLPAVGAVLPVVLDPEQAGEKLAGVGVADAVVEEVDLLVEEGAGDKAPVSLALDELPAGVDQDDLVSRRGLGQHQAAYRDGDERRHKQRSGQGYQPLGSSKLEPRSQCHRRLLASMDFVSCDRV